MYEFANGVATASVEVWCPVSSLFGVGGLFSFVVSPYGSAGPVLRHLRLFPLTPNPGSVVALVPNKISFLLRSRYSFIFKRNYVAYLFVTMCHFVQRNFVHFVYTAGFDLLRDVSCHLHSIANACFLFQI